MRFLVAGTPAGFERFFADIEVLARQFFPYGSAEFLDQLGRCTRSTIQSYLALLLRGELRARSWALPVETQLASVPSQRLRRRCHPKGWLLRIALRIGGGHVRPG